MRMQLTIDQARVYGKTLRKGDTFDVPEKEAKLWKALARAVPARYETAAVKSDDDELKNRRGNRYRRTDMRAED